MTEGRLCERCVHHCPWNGQGMGCSHWEVNRLLGAGPSPCDGVFFVESRPIDLGKLKRDGVQANAQTINTAPIARVKVYEDDPPAVKLLAPGLPVGKHDLYCVPISAAAELAALRAERDALRERVAGEYRKGHVAGQESAMESVATLRARVAELEAAGRAVLECNDKACMMTTRCPAQCQADQTMRAVLRASTKPVPDDDLAALTSLASMLDTIKSQDWAECWSEHDQGLRDWLTRKLREAYAARESTGPSAGGG